MSKPLPKVAIVGQTNVGKSSLFNRMVGAQQAIVAFEPGTTRDNVVGKVRYPLRVTSGGAAPKNLLPEQKFLGGVPTKPVLRGEEADRTAGPATGEFWLIDTAGLKDPEDEFEASIQDQIQDAADVADLIVVAVDGTKYPGDEDRLVAKKALKSKKPVLLAVNKSDLKGALPVSEFLRLGIKTIVQTSAEHNTGIDELLKEITVQIPPRTPEPAEKSLKIALIGRPNVGKSNLFNRLAGKQQAIVAPIAGTTRDVNRVSLKYEKMPVELLDTAGVRRSGKREQGIEKFSVLRTLAAIDEADVCLLLMDVNELSTSLDQKLAGMIKQAGKGLILVVSKWDAVEGKDAYTRDGLAPKIINDFQFTPWAPLIFTSSVTGQNVTKIFDLAREIYKQRAKTIKTPELNRLVKNCLERHPAAGLRNSHPKLKYMVQTDVNPPWFVIFGTDLRYLHWSYKRYLEKAIREAYGFSGTPIMFSFRDEKAERQKRRKTND